MCVRLEQMSNKNQISLLQRATILGHSRAKITSGKMCLSPNMQLVYCSLVNLLH